MGKKYIVELGRCERLYKAFVGGNGKPGLTWLSPEIDLTPYTEPDFEQVRKEGYDDGYSAGFGRKIDTSYQEGLADAWDAARKIHRMPDGDILDLFPDCYASVCTAAQAILKYDASEAIAKIKEYEDSKQEYRVGDEFENGAGKKFVVLKMDGKEIDRYIDGDGKTYVMDMKYRVMRKTGRSFPEISAVLEKMRGEQE